MFHSRELNYKINRLPERCLRVVCHDTTSSIEELLQKDNSVSIHYRNKSWSQKSLEPTGDISKNYDGGLPTEPTFEL